MSVDAGAPAADAADRQGAVRRASRSSALAIIVFALSTHLSLSLAALAVMGAADVVSVVIRFSLVQLRTPAEMRGRVSAVNGMFTGTSNYLGDFRAGAVAALIGRGAGGGHRRCRACSWWRRFGCSFSRSCGVSVPGRGAPRPRPLKVAGSRDRHDRRPKPGASQAEARQGRADRHRRAATRTACGSTASSRRAFPGLSFSHIQRIIRKGEVRVNGKRAQPKDRLQTARRCASRRSSSSAEAARRRHRATRRTAPSSSRSRCTRTTTCWCSTSRWGLRCRAAPAPTAISTACSAR